MGSGLYEGTGAGMACEPTWKVILTMKGDCLGAKNNLWLVNPGSNRFVPIVSKGFLLQTCFYVSPSTCYVPCAVVGLGALY